MCGIAGVMAINRSKFDRNFLEKILPLMCRTIEHRGPDSQGCWIDEEGRLGLGHTRLSILDLSASGHQPITSQCGRWVLSYNGEIYSKNEMAERLKAAGIGLKGSSDTEVFLETIAAWGLEAALENSIGMFAFALFDTQKNELFLGRDRVGIKPLYWGQYDGLL